MKSVYELRREANKYADKHADSIDCNWPIIRDEHFAKLVRNAALEEAAQKCEKLESEHLEVNGDGCASELRNLKDPTF